MNRFYATRFQLVLKNQLRTYQLFIQRAYWVFCIAACLLCADRATAQCTNYTSPGLYSLTVPAGGPFTIRITAKGADGNNVGNGKGGEGATAAATFTIQTGDLLTIIVGEAGQASSPIYSRGGGGGGGTAVVLTRSNSSTLLVAAGGGGGGYFYNSTNGGGGQGFGPSSGGVGGVGNGNDDPGGGGGGLAGPGLAGTNGTGDPGRGGGQASLTAISAGGGSGRFNESPGGRGFGGGGGADDYGSGMGGGGGYGGGKGGFANTPATGGYSYLSPTASTTAITPGVSGGGQNNNGQVTLGFAQSPATATISVSNTVICAGQSTNVTGTINATGTWTIILSDGTSKSGTGTTFSIPVTPPTSTTYTIQCLFDGRGAAQAVNLTGSKAVTVNPLPISFTVTGGGAYCSGGTGKAVGLSDSETGVSYQLLRNGSSVGNPVAGTGNAITFGNQTLAGTYTVLATTTSRSCQQTMSSSVAVSITSLPNASFSGLSSNYCSNGSPVSLVPTTSGGVFSGPGVSGTTFSPASAGVGGTVSYSLSVGGCSNSSSQSVTVSTPPTVDLLNNGPLTCTQTSVTLTASSGGSTYRFSPGASQQGGSAGNIATVSSPGVYSVTLINSNGCSATTSTTVSSNTSVPSISISPSSATLTIASPTASLSAISSSGTLLWSTGETASVISVSASGTYSVTLTNPSGCTATASVPIAGADLTITLTLPQANFASAGSVGNFLVDVFEVGGLPTSAGNVTITITAPIGYTLSFSNSLTSILVSGGAETPVAIDNALWTVTQSLADRQLTLVMNSGQFIGAGHQSTLGFQITRTTANSGSTASITVNVGDDLTRSYDGNLNNNVYARIISGL